MNINTHTLSRTHMNTKAYIGTYAHIKKHTYACRYKNMPSTNTETGMHTHIDTHTNT